MLRLALELGPRPAILAVGCHADDIEIGCGGTVLELLRANGNLDVTWVVLAGEGPRGDEAKAGAGVFLDGARARSVELHRFRDGFFPYVGGEIKEVFEDLKGRVSPDLVFTHTRHDLHQDHRLVCELTWNTFRDHLILEYEIPKYDGDLGSPNVFVPLSEDVARRKAEQITTSFASQVGKDWFDSELFLSLMRIRGMESRSPSGYAEAFTCRKLALRVE